MSRWIRAISIRNSIIAAEQHCTRSAVLYYAVCMNRNDLQNAVRFYEGDVSFSHDPLFRDPKAYVTLNAVFFPGIVNETVKHMERKYLNPLFFLRWEELFGTNGITDCLFHVMKDSMLSGEKTAWRVERLADSAEILKKSRTISFTSTASSGFLPAYGDKQGIVLMEFHLQQGTPVIDLAAFLNDYAKAEETEILLPPYLSLTAHQVPLSASEKKITDRCGDPPAAKYVIRSHGLSFPQPDIITVSRETVLKAAEFCIRMNRDGAADEGTEKAYLHMKAFLRSEMLKQLAGYFPPPCL